MARDPLVGTLFADRFQIESVLGTGGMGNVYLAVHEVLQRQFAIKVIARNLITDRVMAARFRQEARAASRIEHPHVTSVFDFGHTEDGRPYLVMEYVEGPTLHQLLSREAPLALHRALTISSRIADALAAAHACRVVHRDLKPRNIVLTEHRGQPDFVKILDFGLAKLLGEHEEALSMEGQAMGTPDYMSPEQCVAGQVDHRSDIYSFGVLVYELLVGELPFNGSLVEIVSAHLDRAPPTPSRAADNPALAPAIDALILRCLAKRPQDRYQDAATLHNELNQLLRALAPQRTTRSTQPYDEAPTLALQSFEVAAGLVPFTTLPPPPADGEQWDEDSTGDWLRQMEPGLSGASSSTIEEIACILRDRGLGSPELSAALAAKLQAEDRVVEHEALISRLQVQIEEIETTAREREARLKRALTQLEHERNDLKRHHRRTISFGAPALADGPSAGHAELEANLLRISRTIKQIARDAAQETARLQAQLEHQLPPLEQARVEASDAVLQLAALVQQISEQARVAHGSSESRFGAEREGRAGDTDVDVGRPFSRPVSDPLATARTEDMATSPEPDSATEDDPTVAEIGCSDTIDRAGTIDVDEWAASTDSMALAPTMAHQSVQIAEDTPTLFDLPNQARHEGSGPSEVQAAPHAAPVSRRRSSVWVGGALLLAGVAVAFWMLVASEPRRAAVAPPVADQAVAVAPPVADQAAAVAPPVADQAVAVAPPVADQAVAVAPPVADQAAAAAHDATADSPVPASQPRQLLLRSRPSGAAVYLDGLKLGTTPLTIEARATPFRVRLRRPGCVPRTLRVEPSKLDWQVEGGKLTAALDAQLEQAQPADERASDAAAVEARPAVRETPPEERAAAIEAGPAAQRTPPAERSSPDATP